MSDQSIALLITLAVFCLLLLWVPMLEVIAGFFRAPASAEVATVATAPLAEPLESPAVIG